MSQLQQQLKRHEHILVEHLALINEEKAKMQSPEHKEIFNTLAESCFFQLFLTQWKLNHIIAKEKEEQTERMYPSSGSHNSFFAKLTDGEVS